MKLDAKNSHRKERRERAMSFGEDASAQHDAEATQLLEQANELRDEAATAPEKCVDAEYARAISSAVAEKHEQATRLEDRLEQLVDRQAAELQNSLARRPGRLALPSARARWLQQTSLQQAALQRLQGRLQIVREVKDTLTVRGTRLEDLARKKVEHHNPQLVACRDRQVRQERLDQIDRKVHDDDHERRLAAQGVRALQWQLKRSLQSQ